MRVLVVEDHEVLARTIGTGLRQEGMAVDVVLDGTAALEHLSLTRYDVVVLDRDLPGVHGDEVCRQLVADHPSSRVLMLTAASTVKERVDGLGLGADDYLPKPFDFAELVARVRALARRVATPLPPTLACGDLVLDRDLPGVHGDEVCRRITAAGAGSRVLMLTAASTVRDRVQGLGLGADDYLPKPFDFAELVARVRALARRSAPAVPPVLAAGDLRLDPGRRVAERGGLRLDLSPREFAVLECLLAAGGRVVSAEELLERAWDEYTDPFTTAVKTTIRRLRAKLGDPPVIATVREGGYQIGEP